jgi:hypothetical protein
MTLSQIRGCDGQGVDRAPSNFFDEKALHSGCPSDLSGLSIRSSESRHSRIRHPAGMRPISLANGSFADILHPPSVLLLLLRQADRLRQRYRKSAGRTTSGTAPPARPGARGRGATCALPRSSVSKTSGVADADENGGVSAFIGCCCQPFYIKHADDFRRAGPRILMISTTRPATSWTWRTNMPAAMTSRRR